jgi:hypothetical protein
MTSSSPRARCTSRASSPRARCTSRASSPRARCFSRASSPRARCTSRASSPRARCTSRASCTAQRRDASAPAVLHVRAQLAAGEVGGGARDAGRVGCNAVGSIPVHAHARRLRVGHPSSQVTQHAVHVQDVRVSMDRRRPTLHTGHGRKGSAQSDTFRPCIQLRVNRSKQGSRYGTRRCDKCEIDM